MTAVLVVTEGPLAGSRIDLEGELVIGREGATLTIDDSELSRRHAAVRPVDGGFEVEDLGSLNGTFVNGQRIDGRVQIAGGDAIKVGKSVLELEAPRAAATVASVVPAAAPAATPGPAAAGVPAEPFGAYAVPESKGRRRGIASRQLGPMVASWAAVAGTAVALALYFANR
jgi:pSer/pThr/pTyr-binding forkhead associated (FHA) protein